MTDTTVSWKRFYFESNLFFDDVFGPDDWQRLRKAYPNLMDDSLLSAKEATYSGTRTVEQRRDRPQYGFGSEHDGVRTLRDFFVENNMLEQIPARQGEPKTDAEKAMTVVEAIRVKVLAMQSGYKQAAISAEESGYKDSATQARAQYWTLDRVLEAINELTAGPKPLAAAQQDR